MGGKTRAAARAYLDATGADLPDLTADTAPDWCAAADADAEYAALRDFAYGPNGILPRDVVFRAMQRPPHTRVTGCGRVYPYQLEELESMAPVLKISGYNSRMDNAAAVPGAREAERFATAIADVTVSAYVTEDADALTRIVGVLATWARAGAFLDTLNCVQPDGYISSRGACTQWTRSDGQDPSGIKDWTMPTMLMAGLARNYHALLQDHEADTLAEDHAAIARWLGPDLSRRIPTPRDVYFGVNMAYYWPTAVSDMAAGRTTRAQDRLRRLHDGIVRLMNEDGSITDRTTRGDRALWYQHTSIGEAVMSFEMMRAAGVPVSARAEQRLHAAVDLFLRAVDDYAVLDPWARQRHNGSYKGGTQDWNRMGWPSTNFGGSWFHVYPYRYPDHPNAARLRAKVSWRQGSATRDTDFGVGVGCIYNLAAGVVN